MKQWREFLVLVGLTVTVLGLLVVLASQVVFIVQISYLREDLQQCRKWGK